MNYFTPESDPNLFSCPCGKCDTKPSERLLRFLNEMRERAGIPIYIDSGPRCPAYNKKIGGARYSEHPDGDGADPIVYGSRNRFRMIKAALDAGCRRIGVGKSKLHVGVSQTHDQDVFWVY